MKEPIFDGEDAERHWLCVVDIGQVHVSRWVQIELEVSCGKLKVELRHGVIVTIVAVA